MPFRGPPRQKKKKKKGLFKSNFIRWYHHHQNTHTHKSRKEQSNTIKKKNLTSHKSLVQDTPREMRWLQFHDQDCSPLQYLMASYTALYRITYFSSRPPLLINKTISPKIAIGNAYYTTLDTLQNSYSDNINCSP